MSSQTTMTKTTTTKTVTVERRGCFDDDAFFQDSRSLFNNAISDVVNNWDNSTNTKKTTTTTNKSINNTSNTSNTNISNTNTSNTNTSNNNKDTTVSNKDLQAYRQIRTQNLTKDDSQAICCVEEDNQYKMVVDVKDYKSDEINVLVTEEDVIVVEGTIERKVGNSTSSQSFRRQFNLPPCVDFTRVTSALSKDGVLKIIAPFKKGQAPIKTGPTKKTVTVEKRGCFNDDAFFQDSKDTLNNAMSEVVNNWDHSTNTKKKTTTTNNTNTSNTNIATTYKQIRDSNLDKTDSQAVSCVEKGGQYQMVVDVKDYKSDEIKVLVTEEDVIVIEGTIERKVGNSTSSKSFKRQFNLPPCVDFTRVTSALSKDGILKIVAPFKV